MKNDASWKRLIKALWKYQFIRNPCYELDPKISDLLHFECQGITDIGVKLFLLSQIRVMTTAKGDEDETITKAIIKSVASDQLSLARPMLNALKRASKSSADYNLKWAELKEFEDLYIDLQPYITEAEDGLIELSYSLEDEDNSPEETRDQTLEQTQTSDGELNGLTKETQSKNSSSKAQVENSLNPVLQPIIEQGRRKKLPAYHSLKEAGFIKSATEFDCSAERILELRTD